jgi:hypothetical protein
VTNLNGSNTYKENNMNENILEMLGREKQTPSPSVKEEGLGNKVDSDVLSSMLTADGVDGNFRTEEEPKEENLEDSEKIKISDGKVKEQLGKYSKEFIKDVMKRPDQYTVETSRGVMTVRDAINAGWDPKTDEFLEENRDKSKEQIAKLEESDQNAINDLLNPENAGIPAAVAEEDGLSPDSPLIRKPPLAIDPSTQVPTEMSGGGAGAEPPLPQEGGQGMSPEQLKALLGGLM